MLVLRPGALGDALLAVPALRALRRSLPPVTLAAHAAAVRFLVSVGEIDHGLAFDDASLTPLFTGNCVPDQPVVAWTSARLRYATLQAPSRPVELKHVAHYLLETLASLGVEQVFDDRPLAVTPIPSNEILVHPGSGSPTKNWPADRFADVIRASMADVRLVVGEADAPAASAIETQLGRKLPRLEDPPLEELAARLAGCRGYLGNDSGVSHLAGLCGVHTVVLFGPTNAAMWKPVGPSVEVLPFDATTSDVLEALAR